MRPHLSSALGTNSGREEFQVGRVIVWVEGPAYFGSRGAWLERADYLFGEVWAALPAILSAAEQRSRVMIPEFWKAHDDTGTAVEQLAVRGIWLDPATGSADYEVGCNYEFNGAASLPELPDGHTLIVRRDSGGRVFNLD